MFSNLNRNTIKKTIQKSIPNDAYNTNLTKRQLKKALLIPTVVKSMHFIQNIQILKFLFSTPDKLMKYVTNKA